MMTASLVQKIVTSLQDGMDLVFGVAILYLYWIVKSKMSVQDVRTIFKELFEHQEKVLELKFELLRDKISELKEDLKTRGN